MQRSMKSLLRFALSCSGIKKRALKRSAPKTGLVAWPLGSLDLLAYRLMRSPGSIRADLQLLRFILETKVNIMKLRMSLILMNDFKSVCSKYQSS